MRVLMLSAAVVLVAATASAAEPLTGGGLLAECRDASGRCDLFYTTFKTRRAIGRAGQAGAGMCLGSPSSTSSVELRRFRRAAVTWLQSRPERHGERAADLVPEIARTAFPCPS
ncbi:MAG: Rap1a/Tai family immunity protein [Rhodospirillaceae bacterium]